MLHRFAQQFHSVLLASVALPLLPGHDFDATGILGVVRIITAIGFVQKDKTKRAGRDRGARSLAGRPATRTAPCVWQAGPGRTIPGLP